MYILPHRNAVRMYPFTLTGDTGSQSIPNQKIVLKTKQAHGVPESKTPFYICECQKRFGETETSKKYKRHDEPYCIHGKQYVVIG